MGSEDILETERWEREKQLSAMWFQDGLTDEDRAWLREQIEVGGERVPAVDMSWVTVETLGPDRALGLLVTISIIVVVVATLGVTWIAMWGGR